MVKRYEESHLFHQQLSYTNIFKKPTANQQTFQELTWVLKHKCIAVKQDDFSPLLHVLIFWVKRKEWRKYEKEVQEKWKITRESFQHLYTTETQTYSELHATYENSRIV